MNIIAIMGPHGVFYKDEPIKELESALVAQGFQIIWPQNSVDLLKFIEHNPRICGVIFDWDEYSLDLCSDINQLNEYLPLYAFINTHSTMDVSVQDMKKARLAVCFMIFSAGIPSRLMSLFRSPSLVRCSTTPGHTWKRKSTSRGLLARNRVISLPTEHRRRTKLWVCTPRHPAVRC